MSGGIVQLVATGAQDTWLTGKPEISFFRSNYKRYTHYALSCERQIIQGNPTAGSISTIRFEKKGDLLSYVYFIGKDTSGALIPGIDWSKVVDRIELLIGGQVVDTQDITWMTQIEPITGAQNYSQRYLNNDPVGLTNVINGFLPLKFFFCKDWSVSLPLVALQYHDIELRITWNQNLNYRVNYETYSVAAPSVANIPGAGSAVTGTNAVTTNGLPTLTIANTGLTNTQGPQATAFTFSGATGALLPGMTIASVGGQTVTVSNVAFTNTSNTAGTFIGWFATAPTAGAVAATSVTVASYSATTATITTIAGGIQTASTQTVYPGVTLAFSAGALVEVNMTIPLASFTSTPFVNGTVYISAITAATSTTATVTLIAVGSTITGGVSIAGSGVTITPSYPIVNLAYSSQVGAITPGQNIIGTPGGLVATAIPSVNTIYPTMLAINTNQLGVAASTINTNLSGASSSAPLSFIPSIYYAAVSTTASGAFAASGGGTTGALTVANAVGGGPRIAGSIFVTQASTSVATALTTAFVSSYVSATPSIAIQYASSTATTQFPANFQFVVIPQFAAATQLAAVQPAVDRASTAILSLSAGAAPTATTIAVGQQVLGTQYTGPVTVSQIITTGGNFLIGTGTATIEVQFPIQQTIGASTTSGASGPAIVFIDPTPAGGELLPGVTTTTTGFSGTYAQLQYEAWCSFLYLDQAEREYFAQTPIDILVTQINRVPINPLMTHEVNLAHPVKFLAFQSNSYSTAYANQSTAGYPSAASYQLKTQINGVDIGDTRSLFQWQDVPQYYHTPFGYKAATGTAPVTLISYCLDTSKLQPTGTLNFSRLDSYRLITPSGATLATLAGGTTGYIYAMNYNVLRIQKGMGGLLYSS
jgi:hypothetical protein